MMRPAGIRGICFDLWNTLAFTDHSPNPIRALAEAFGLDAAPGWRRTIEEAIMTRPLSGISEAIDVLAHETSRSIGAPMTRRDLTLMWGAASNKNRLYPDAIPALRALGIGHAPYRLAILSNTQSFDLDFMSRDGLDAMMSVICLSCHTGLLKPTPGSFHKVARMMGLPPEEILMVGDRPGDDVDGAVSAGMNAVLLDRTGAHEGQAAVSIRNLTDLIGILRRPDGLIVSS
jgi:HAD superfamily hydrolase (TIGR01509 family)